jgi:hypothetical protein
MLKLLKSNNKYSRVINTIPIFMFRYFINFIIQKKADPIHLVTQISTMYHCNISCNFRNYYQKYDQFLPIVSE